MFFLFPVYVYFYSSRDRFYKENKHWLQSFYGWSFLIISLFCTFAKEALVEMNRYLFGCDSHAYFWTVWIICFASFRPDEIAMAIFSKQLMQGSLIPVKKGDTFAVIFKLRQLVATWISIWNYRTRSSVCPETNLVSKKPIHKSIS